MFAKLKSQAVTIGALPTQPPISFARFEDAYRRLLQPEYCWKRFRSLLKDQTVSRSDILTLSQHAGAEMKLE